MVYLTYQIVEINIINVLYKNYLSSAKSINNISRSSLERDVIKSFS